MFSESGRLETEPLEGGTLEIRPLNETQWLFDFKANTGQLPIALTRLAWDLGPDDMPIGESTSTSFNFVDGPGCKLKVPNDLASLECESKRTFILSYYRDKTGSQVGYEFDFLNARLTASRFNATTLQLQFLVEDKSHHSHYYFTPVTDCAIAP